MYKSKLTMKETQKAIKIVKDCFENKLASEFNLDRVSAPLIVKKSEGINDDLGIENSAISFFIEDLNGEVEIVQSLAKWKRFALKKYQYKTYEGIYADMNAIRQLDVTDKTHSVYVDQWDYEIIIKKADRHLDFLYDIVKRIVKKLSETKALINKHYDILNEKIEETVFFIEAEQLFNMYPTLTTKEREREITRKYKTVFISKIGYRFAGNQIHDLRATDYDDWQLNGDILIWSNVIDDAIEISSMGIRVDKESLTKQLAYANKQEYSNSFYQQLILNDELPLTLGGGIGQSRICMILLEKMHIAEVQASLWSKKEMLFFKEMEINFL